MRGVLLILLVSYSACIPSGDYQNPLQSDNSPDPGALLRIEGTYFIATTSGDLPNAFPIRKSSDFIDWEVVGHIFPATSKTRPSWAKSDFWAPEIHHIWGYHLAVFAARNAEGVLCVGLAYSDAITGPYVDIGAPLVYDHSVGNIDPTLIVENSTGDVFVVWKVDGNGHVPPIPTPIYAQQLVMSSSSDKIPTFSLVGEKVELIQETLPWEGNLVEGPWVVFTENLEYSYYLFYSANAYYNASYAVGVARAKSLLGPYEKYPVPILHSNSAWEGPGHCSVVPFPNEHGLYHNHMIIYYHSWVAGHTGGNYPRMLLMDVVTWDDSGWPSVPNSSPSIGPQKIPN